MLIELTDAALTHALGEDAEWFWAGLGHLARAHRAGRHHLTAGHALGALLRRGHPLDAYAAATLRALPAAEHAELARAAQLRVVDGRDVRPDSRPYRASMDWFADEAASRSAVLIVEGDDDGEILERVARAFAASRKLPMPTLERRIGGGGNVEKVLRIQQTQRTIWLGVVDSDRDRAGAGVGSTARGARSAWVPQTGPGELLVLSAREMENLIPRPLALAVADTQPAYAAGILAVYGQRRFADPFAQMKAAIGERFLTACVAALQVQGDHAVWRTLALEEGDELLTLAAAVFEVGRAPRPTITGL